MRILIADRITDVKEEIMPERSKFVLRDGFIDRLRRFSGLASDARIAAAMGVTRQEFSQVANGEREPSLAFLAGMFDAFGFTPGEVGSFAAVPAEQVKTA